MTGRVENARASTSPIPSKQASASRIARIEAARPAAVSLTLLARGFKRSALPDAERPRRFAPPELAAAGQAKGPWRNWRASPVSRRAAPGHSRSRWQQWRADQAHGAKAHPARKGHG